MPIVPLHKIADEDFWNDYGPGSVVPTAPNPHYYCEECGKDLWDKHRRLMNPSTAPDLFKTLDDRLLCENCFYDSTIGVMEDI